MTNDTIKIQLIKKAVDNGLNVETENGAYKVIKDRIGQYLIMYVGNQDVIGLCDLSETKLNQSGLIIKL